MEQSQIGWSGFLPQEIHSLYKLSPVSSGLNQLKANYYSSIRPFTGGGTVRDWLTGQSFADQYEFGMDAAVGLPAGCTRAWTTPRTTSPGPLPAAGDPPDAAIA